MLIATRLAHAFLIVVFCFATIGCGGSTEPTSTEGVPDIPTGERTAPSDGDEDNPESGVPALPPE
jgi:hypothetical protein